MPELQNSEVNIVTQTKTKAWSFKGFDIKKLILGLKRPAIALIGYGLMSLSAKPEWAWVGGLSAAGLWGTVEYYIKSN